MRLTVVEADQGPVAVPDPARRLGGRGAWLHPRRDCVDTALRRNALSRAFRSRVQVEDPERFLRSILDAGAAPGAE